jgi:hypothetical protein
LFSISWTLLCPFFSLFFLLRSPMSLFYNKNFWEIATRTWSIYLVDGKPIKHDFVFTPSVGETFLGGSKWNVCFCAYFQCKNSAYLGGVYVILILKAWQASL